MGTNDSERALIRKMIMEDYLFTDDESALGDDMSFLDKGILDSMGILEIIMFLEDQFGVKVLENEMVPENLDSVDNLVAYIFRKRKE